MLLTSFRKFLRYFLLCAGWWGPYEVQIILHIQYLVAHLMHVTIHSGYEN